MTEYITTREIVSYLECKRGWQLQRKGLSEGSEKLQDMTEKERLVLLEHTLRIRTIAAWLFLGCGVVIMVSIIVISLI